MPPTRPWRQTLIDAEMVRKFNQTITEDLFPVILEYFRPLMLVGLAEGYKLSGK